MKTTTHNLQQSQQLDEFESGHSPNHQSFGDRMEPAEEQFDFWSHEHLVIKALKEETRFGHIADAG